MIPQILSDWITAKYKHSGWITLKQNDSGYARVHIGEDGKITRGPKELSGKTVKQLTNDTGKKQMNRNTREVIKEYKEDGVSISREDLESAIDVIYEGIEDESRSREKAKKFARQVANITQRDISRLENSHQDVTKIDGFDIAAERVADEFPELGLGVRGELLAYASRRCWGS